MKIRTMRNRLGALTCAAAVTLSSAGLVSAEEAAESAGASAAGQEITAETLREMQQEVLDLKLEQEGTETLLTGNLLDGAGEADNDWFALDAARMGAVSEEERAAYLYRLQETVTELYADLEANTEYMRPSDWYRIILTVTALGGNAESFGTDASGNPVDLVNDGIWNCVLGDPGNQGLNGYTWALLAVDCGGFQEPEDAAWTREQLVSEILSREQEDGGYALMRGESDSDLTAMALTALAPYREDETTYTVENIYTEETRTLTVAEAGEEAFLALSGMQDEDGAMITSGQPTSESTVQTLNALCAWGRNPLEAEEFQNGGHSLIDGLLSFRNEDGSFAHSRDDANSELMSQSMPNYQAIYGLESCIRLLEGRSSLYTMDDAETVSEETIQAVGKSLPARQTEEEDAGLAEVQQQTKDRKGLIIGILAAVVAVVAVVLILMGRKKKTKRKPQEKRESEADDWDEDDDW